MKLRKTAARRVLAVLLVIIILSVPVTALAAKKRIRTKSATGGGVSYSSAKLSRSSNSIILTMKNLAQVTRVSYELTYTANGLSQGAGGALVPKGQTSESRDLYFGTCSHGACTPHTNIKNAALRVTTTLKSGARHTKRYKLKL